MKTAIITGAGGNLGKACVKKFLDSGWRVIAAERNEDGLKHFAGKENVETQVLNATNESECNEVVQQVINKHGKIDAALMLIGGYASGTIEELGEKDIQKMFSLNFNTAYFVARPVFKSMLAKQQGGKLVFMAAAPALSDTAGYPMIAYTLAKSLVLKLAKILNSEDHKKNIQCAVIAPTTIDTPENRSSTPDADFSKWTQPEEIAEVIEFFCSSKGDKMKEVVIKM